MIVLLLLVALALTQPALPPLPALSERSESNGQPTFRTTAVTVEVDVVVTDGKGQFVSDLTADDFELREEGQPQTLDALGVVGSPASPAGGANRLRQGYGGQEAPPLPVPPQQPGAQAPRRFVWIFDDLHTTPGGLTRVRDGLVQFIRSDLQPGDVGGIVVTGVSSGLQLTSNREQLMESARKLRASSAPQSRRAFLNDWPRFMTDEEAWRIVSGDRITRQTVVLRAWLDPNKNCRTESECEPFVDDKARQVDAASRQAAQQTLAVVLAVTRALATLPGRSVVVMATEGFLTPGMRAELDRIEQMSADARVTIYAIDSRGLRDSGRDITGPVQGPDGGVLATMSGDPLDGGVNWLAAVTGGRVIRSQNRVDRAFGEIAQEASRYYVLAYRPTRGADKEEWRRITVRVKRPDLHVAARRGYRARPDTTPTAPSALLTPPVLSTPPVPSAPSAASVPSVPLVPSALSVPPASASARPGSVASYGETPSARAGSDASLQRLRAAAVRPAPAAIEQRAASAWAAYQRGDVETVRTIVRALDPATTPAWTTYLLGLSELALGRAAGAADAWERVRAAAPDFEPVYFDLADAYITTGELGRALAVLRSAAGRWPGDAEVWNATGIVLLRRSAFDDAVVAFEKATGLAPGDGLSFYNLGRALEIRYERSRRWSRVDRSSTANRTDLAAALIAYSRAATLGGATEESAKAALARLSR